MVLPEPFIFEIIRYYANFSETVIKQLYNTKKIFWLLKKLHLLVDAAPSTRLLHALRQPVFMTVRRGAFLLPERSMRT